jgi:UDP-N-acetylmuramyl tripeptide synthase
MDGLGHKRRESKRRGGTRDAVAIVAARLASMAARHWGHAATSLPGLVAERIAPGIASRVSADLESFVLVTGTNGKTTTTRLLAHLLQRAGRTTLSNQSGANLEQALASTLLAGADVRGHRDDRGATAVLEVDEAALSNVALATPVTMLVMTNLFRDQLDRFGETDEIVRHWRDVLGGLPPDAPIVVCADDPRLADLASARPGRLRDYGLSGPPPAGPELSLTPDVSTCPRCDGHLDYSWRGIGHLGSFACRTCDFRRRDPQLAVRIVSSHGIDGQTLAFREPESRDEVQVAVQLPGTSNAYNAAAAVAAAMELGIALPDAVAGLADAGTPWGRYEDLDIEGRRVILMLGKNPASLSELVRIGAESDVSAVLFAMNDGFPDGRDVSWYWDVNPAAMLDGNAWAVSGTRASDFRLRMKYEAPRNGRDALAGLVGAYDDPAAGLDGLIAATSPGDTILAVATYTALLGLRGSLEGRGLVPAFPR